MAAQKPANVSKAGNTANFMIAADNDAAGGGQRECKGAVVGQIPLRRQQQDHDGDEHDRQAAVRPGGGDPESNT